MGRECALLGILCCVSFSSRPAEAKSANPATAKHAASRHAATAKHAAPKHAAAAVAGKATRIRAAKKKSPALVKTAVRPHHEDAVPTSYFLAANPHVPLAVVREGAVRPAVARSEFGKSCGSKRRWASEGTSWHALDAWGKFVGTATVDIVDDYDVTTCGEVYFAPKFDRTNTMLFVSTDSSYVPGTSLEWAAPANAQWKFKALLAKQATPPKRQLPYTCSEIQKPVRFFRAGDTKLAVGGSDGALLIAAFDGTGWKTERVEHAEDTPMCFRPVSVLDMNGDGRPEVVMREVVGQGQSWQDVVLSRDESGHWSLVAVSPGGSTA